jgi:hypothetical protein
LVHQKNKTKSSWGKEDGQCFGLEGRGMKTAAAVPDEDDLVADGGKEVPGAWG